MKKFDLKKAILENKATFFSSLSEGYDEFQRADKGSKDVTAKNKGEEEVYGAGVKKGEEIEKKKMKESTNSTKGKTFFVTKGDESMGIKPGKYTIVKSYIEDDENVYDIKDEEGKIITVTQDYVQGKGYWKNSPLASNKMKESELRAKIKEMIVAEMALDIDTMEDAPESEVDFLAELEGMLDEAKEEETEEEIEVTDEFSGEEEGEGGISVSQNADADLTGNKKQVQDNLEAALEAAKTLGDEKLATQIGNSLTFFTKQHVVK